MKNIIFILLLLSPIIQLNSQELTTRDVATNLDTPWEILWGPDSYIWMTERYGRISKVNPETGELKELYTFKDVYEDGERGLMGLALHPYFPDTPFVYTIYSYLGKKNETLIKIVRLEYKNEKLQSPITIFDSIPGAWNHDGARLWIDKDLTMFVTMGDAAVPNRAQDMNSLNGKILRMNLDGTIPFDNPFPNSYVWSLGHRNPQGLVKYSDILYSSEHGANTDDELNIIVKGRNYGWPNVEGFCDKTTEKSFCEKNNVIEPIAAWTPTIAVAGIDYYHHNLIPEWNNSILAVALKASVLVQNKLSEDRTKVISQTKYFEYQFGRLRDLCISPDGRVFIATSNKDGRGSPKAQDDRIIEIKLKFSTIHENNQKKIEIKSEPSGFLKISLSKENSQVYVFDILGNKFNPVYQSDYTILFQLPKGIYFIQEQNESNSNVYKHIHF